MNLKHVILVFLILGFTSKASSESSPLEQTKAFVEAMKSVTTLGEKSYPKIDAYINFDYITSETIKPHLKSFNQLQIDTFKPLLQKLIRMVAYPNSGEFYNDAKYTYEPPTVHKEHTLITMNMVLLKDDVEMKLGYYWQNKNAVWQLTDLSFDEDSLVKDYQNQFGRIIAKEGVDPLIQKLKDRINEIEKENNTKK